MHGRAIHEWISFIVSIHGVVVVVGSRAISYDGIQMVITRKHSAVIVQIFVENREFSIHVCFRRRRQFLSRVSILTRDIDIANMSICLSVTFRYQMKTA